MSAPAAAPAAGPAGAPKPQDVLSLWEFFQAFVRHNNVSLTVHPCHEEICDLYQAAVLGKMEGYEYFVVNMPRRTGKTKILEALPCWVFGEFDGAQNLYGCYSDKLVLRSMAYIRATLEKPWYQGLYGNILRNPRADLISTVGGGSLYGAGTGATIAGFGAGLKEPAGGFIALDDPAKPDEALSAVERENVIKNFETTWKGCRNSDRWTPILINAQRIGPDDLPGYVLSNYRNKTFHLKFPCRVAGISVFPETWSTDTLNDLEKTRMGRYVLASQFQQDPVAIGGNLIVTDEFRWYDPSPGLKFQTKIITCDTAFTKKEENDYCVLQCWGRQEDQPNAYMIDQVRGHWESPQLLTQARLFWQKHNADQSYPVGKFMVEEATAGLPLMQQLAQIGIPTEGIVRVKDKAARVQDILPYISTGLVYLPKNEPWIPEFLDECAAFTQAGNHLHDDQVDPMADAIKELCGGGGGILSAFE